MLYFLGMKDPRLAAALLTSSPDALAELFDAYGDRLFRYCWSMLRSRELAQVALRDTLLVAQAHIARLADPEDPESLGPWLYSLARAECRRHQAVAAADADESPARQGLPAADARLMSWNAAMSLDAAEFEALDLACRHYVDLGQVLGLPAADAEDLLDRARQNLERALGAEILAGRGPACPGRDAVLATAGLAAAGLASAGLAGQSGPLTAQARERVLEHAAGCAACDPEIPRNVSATRIFALLPTPALTPQDRTEVLSALAGDQPLAAPALAQAALVPGPAASTAPPAASTPAPAVPGPVPAASGLALGASAPTALATSAPVPAPPAPVPAPPSPVPAPPSPVPAPPSPVPAPPSPVPAPPAPVQSVLGPSLASYVRVPEPPSRASAVPVPESGSPSASAVSVPAPVSSAPVSSGPVPAAPSPAASVPSLAASVQPAAAPLIPVPPLTPIAPLTSAVPLTPATPLTPVASGPASPTSTSPTRASKPRRVHRGRLLVAGAGVLVSGVVIASAIAVAGPGKSAAAERVTPTLAAGSATGPALQAAGLGAGPVSTRAPSGTKATHPAGVQTSTPPPLAGTKNSKNQVMITTATQPLPPDQAPGARPNGSGTGGAPATLHLSADSVNLGAGSTGQLTLSASGGTVDWSASASPADQVSLSSYSGTLPAGQSVTVTVQVSRGTGAGRAALSFQLPGSDTLVIPVTWSAQPTSSGPSWHPHPPPGPSPSSGSMSSAPAPDPSSLDPDGWHQSGHHDRARLRSGRP